MEGKNEEGGVPIFLDGFAYSGIVNIQTVYQKWPATAGIGEESHTILGAFKKQSQELKQTQIEDDDENEEDE